MSTYAVDSKDTLCELKDIPQMDPGAPSPLILSNEFSCAVAYYGRVVLGPPPALESIAVVIFDGHVHYSGNPNDEALSGHPLYSRGLRSYAAFEVFNSSWIRKLGQLNRVHPHHRSDVFSTLRHFVLTFHDSTFECVGRGYESLLLDGSMSDALARMKDRLEVY